MATQMQIVDGRPATSLERLADDYLISCRARGVSPRTDEQYSFSLHTIFLPWCTREGITDVSELDHRTCDRFTSSLLTTPGQRGKPLAKHSVHTYVRPVRLMLNWAKTMGEEVVAQPQLPRRPKLVREVLSREEIDLLEDKLWTERDKLIIRVFGDCGVRLEELAALRPGDIVRSARQTHLLIQGKGDRQRHVPVMPPLLRRLERHIDARPDDRSENRVFLGSRRSRRGLYEPLTRSGVYQVVKDSVARAGLKKRVHPHLLRHSWMTEMLRNGMDPIQLSSIAGTSVEVIARYYAHLTTEDAYQSVVRVLGASERRR